MKLNHMILLIAGLALVFAGASAATTLEVVTNNPPGNAACQAQPGGCPEDAACVSEGEYAMRVTADGDTQLAYVEADDQQGFDNESIVRASFDINLRNVTVPHGHKWFVHTGLKAGAGLRPYQLLVSFNVVRGYKIWCQAAQNNGNIDKSDKLDLAPDAFNRVQVEWAHNEPGNSDAICRVSITGGPMAGQEATLTDFRNTLHSVGRARLGFNGRVVSGMDGPVCFDDFQSFRTLAPP